MHEEHKQGIERRQFFRLDMEEELIDIFWQDSKQQHQKKIACLDFSRGGLKIACEHAIDVDTSVEVIFQADNPNSQRLYGKILRCQQILTDVYEIAVQLDGAEPKDLDKQSQDILTEL